MHPPQTDNLNSGTFKELEIEGSAYQFFGGTAYLSLHNHPDFLQLFKEGLDIYGLNNGTSRTNNVQLGIYKETEEQLAKQFGFDDSLLLSSGYLAAQLCIRKLSQNRITLFAPGSHPALWLDNTAPTPPQNFDDWVDTTLNHIQKSEEKHFLIVSNTVNNIIPEFYNFSRFKEIPADKYVHFLLDDSHGIGVLSPDTIHSLSTVPHGYNREITVVASLAKGMGIDAGIILCSQTVSEELKNSGFFIGASPSSPAFIYTLKNATSLFKNQQSRLQENILYFSQHLSEDWIFLKNFPVFIHKKKEIYSELIKRGFIITYFPYPNPDDNPIERIVISAHHTQEDLDKLIEVLQKIDAI